MKIFCQGDAQIENFCEIETMSAVEQKQNRLQEFYYTGTPMTESHNGAIN